MRKIKKTGEILWGIVYLMGTVITTFLLLPFIIVVAIINLMLKENA